MSRNRNRSDEPLRFHTREELENFTIEELSDMLERAGLATDNVTTKEEHIDKYMLGQIIMMDNINIAKNISIVLNTK